MPSTANIQRTLDLDPVSTVSDSAVSFIPSAITGLEILDTSHAVVASYSPETAEDMIPLGAEAGLLKKIVLGLAPLFLAFGWVAFFKALRQVGNPKKKKFERWMDVGVSFITAAGTTLVISFFFAGLVYGAPYLLAAILGINALQGLYYTIKNLMLAYEHKAHRWQFLKAAGKHFLGIATNTLAMVLNIFVFQAAELIAGGIQEFASSLLSIILHFDELMSFINGPVTTAVTNIKGVALAWLGLFLFGLARAAAAINKESWHMMTKGTEPEQAIFEREALNELEHILNIIGSNKAHPLKRIFLALTAPITIPLYATTIFLHAMLARPLAALVLGLPQLLYNGLKQVFCSEEPEPGAASVSISTDSRVREGLGGRSHATEKRGPQVEQFSAQAEAVAVKEKSSRYAHSHFKAAQDAEFGAAREQASEAVVGFEQARLKS